MRLPNLRAGIVEILTDIGAGAQPGYPAVGRLKGMAEMRGVMAALSHGAA